MECYIFLNQQTVPGMIKVSLKEQGVTLKHYFLWAQKQKNQTFKMDLFKGVTLAKSRHLGLGK